MFSLWKYRIFITVPVTNKLLIPCRVLDSHFYRLPDSALCLPLPPPPPPLPFCPLLAGLFFARYLLPFSIREVSVLSHCRLTTTASSNVRDPPAQRPPPHPLDATFLASLTPRALLSFCFALVQKPTWAVCSYRCVQRWTRAYGKPEQGKTLCGMSALLHGIRCVMQADNIVRQELVSSLSLQNKSLFPRNVFFYVKAKKKGKLSIQTSFIRLLFIINFSCKSESSCLTEN